jgi:ABC-type sugar transport system substrate-binding protein
MKKNIIIILFLFLFINNYVPSDIYAERKIKIAIFTMRSKDDMFFSLVVGFMRAACDNLGMDLTAFYGQDDHLYLVEQLQKASEEKRFDAIVVLNFKKQLIRMANILDDNKTPFFIYNAGFDDDDNSGNPREKFKYWLGEMLPDDEKAGYDLAKIISRALNPQKDGKIHLIGIGGNIADQASIERVKGLNRFVKESNGKVVLDQVTYASWLTTIAEDKFPLIHTRYPENRGFWTASDGMAIGIAHKTKEIKLKAIIGGVDWSKEGIDAVKKRQIFVTMGGHFMEGAWISIILYDYFNGIDFKNSEGFKMKSWMSPITYQNAEKYQNTIGKKENWGRINFKNFSKIYNKKLSVYDFSQNAVLAQFK